MGERYMNHGGASHSSSASATHALRHLTEASPGDGTAQEVTGADITIVRTAREFQAAITSGVQDLQVRGHIDLSSLALDFSTDRVLTEIRSTTRSIRGNCTTPPPPLSELALAGPPLLWTPPQCLVVSDQDGFVVGANKKLWLDALHLRARPSRWRRFIFLRVIDGGVLYATRMTLQGDGVLDTQAVQTWFDSKLYLHGSVVDSLWGPRPLFDIYYGSAYLQQVTLSNVNHTWALGTTGFEEHDELGPAPAPGLSDDYYGFGAGQGTAVLHVWGDTASIVALNTTFENVTTPRRQVFLSYEGGLVVAEDTQGAEEQVYAVDFADYATVPGPASAPSGQAFPRDTIAAAPASALDNFESSRVPLATESDPWFVAVRQALESAGPAQFRNAPQPPPNPPPPPPPGVAGGAPPQIAAVYSAAQLQRAFHAGVRDIEVRAHLDLRSLPRREDPASDEISAGTQFGFVGSTTRSIRGGCQTAPPSALTPQGLNIDIRAEEPWHAPRCVLVVADHLIVADSPALWLDSLHIQIAPDPPAAEGAPGSSLDYSYNAFDISRFDYDYSVFSSGRGILALALTGWARVYVTNTVVQGDATTRAAAVWIESCAGGLYMQGSVLNALPGRLRFNGDAGSVVAHVSLGAVFFDSCTFVDLGPSADGAYDYTWEAGVGAIDVSGGNASVALRNCSLADINAAMQWPVSAERAAEVFSDDPGLVVGDSDEYTEWWSGGDQAAESFSAAPLPSNWRERRSARTPAPPQADDPWFVAAQKVLEAPSPDAYLSRFPSASASPALAPREAPGEAPAPGPVDESALAPDEASLLPPPSSDGALAALGLRPADADSSLGNAAKIGIVTAVLVVLGVATCVAAFVQKRLRGRSASTGDRSEEQPKQPQKPAAAAAEETSTQHGDESYGSIDADPEEAGVPESTAAV